MFAAHARAGEISVRRDARYLQWRYRAHPAESYKTVACERDGRLCGYCVSKVQQAGDRAPRGYIVDLQVLPDAASAGRLLLSHALLRLREQGVRVAMSWERPAGPEQSAPRKHSRNRAL